MADDTTLARAGCSGNREGAGLSGVTRFVAAFLVAALGAAGGDANVIRGGAGFGRFEDYSPSGSKTVITGGYGRSLNRWLEADAGVVAMVRPYGLILDKYSVDVHDTLWLVPLGLRAVSGPLAGRWRFHAGTGASIVHYTAKAPFPGGGLAPSFSKLGWHALGGVSYSVRRDGRLRVGVTPRFTGYNGRGLFNRVFTLTGEVEWRF